MRETPQPVFDASAIDEGDLRDFGGIIHDMAWDASNRRLAVTFETSAGALPVPVCFLSLAVVGVFWCSAQSMLLFDHGCVSCNMSQRINSIFPIRIDHQRYFEFSHYYVSFCVQVRPAS